TNRRVRDAQRLLACREIRRERLARLGQFDQPLVHKGELPREDLVHLPARLPAVALLRAHHRLNVAEGEAERLRMLDEVQLRDDVRRVPARPSSSPRRGRQKSEKLVVAKSFDGNAGLSRYLSNAQLSHNTAISESAARRGGVSTSRADATEMDAPH